MCVCVCVTLSVGGRGGVDVVYLWAKTDSLSQYGIGIGRVLAGGVDAVWLNEVESFRPAINSISKVQYKGKRHYVTDIPI